MGVIEGECQCMRSWMFACPELAFELCQNLHQLYE